MSQDRSPRRGRCWGDVSRLRGRARPAWPETFFDPSPKSTRLRPLVAQTAASFMKISRQLLRPPVALTKLLLGTYMKGGFSTNGRLRLLLLSLAVMVLPVCGVAWLSWKVVEHDRIVDRQRSQERCETAAETAVAEIGRRALELEKDLQGFERGAAVGGAAFLLRSGDRLVRSAGERLAFYPAPSPERRMPEGVFAAAEQLEFAVKQPAAAAAVYKNLAEFGPVDARAEAWLRVARSWRQAGRPQDALSAYARLECCSM